MKKILMIATVALTLALSACGGKSEADKQQLQEARQAAGEMLDKVNRADAGAPAAALPQTPDSITQK